MTGNQPLPRTGLPLHRASPTSPVRGLFLRSDSAVSPAAQTGEGQRSYLKLRCG